MHKSNAFPDLSLEQALQFRKCSCSMNIIISPFHLPGGIPTSEMIMKMLVMKIVAISQQLQNIRWYIQTFKCVWVFFLNQNNPLRESSYLEPSDHRWGAGNWRGEASQCCNPRTYALNGYSVSPIHSANGTHAIGPTWHILNTLTCWALPESSSDLLSTWTGLA